MKKRILITGGAGTSSHRADRLLSEGYSVSLSYCLLEQVHGPDAVRSKYLDPGLELVNGDVRDAEAVRRALGGVDTVFHFAAMVGVGREAVDAVAGGRLDRTTCLHTVLNWPGSATPLTRPATGPMDLSRR